MSILDALANPDLLNGVPQKESSTQTAEEEKREETPAAAQPTVETSKEESNISTETKSEETTEAVKVEENKEPKIEGAQTTEQKEPETPKVTKHKIDYLKFIEEHGDKINAYKSEKSADYSKMSPEDLLFKSYKIKYPSLSEEDIREELKSRYGVGVNTDDFEEDDHIAYRAKQRKLKIDSVDAMKDLEAYRESLTLPDFELELPEPEVQTPDSGITAEEVIKKAVEDQQKADLEWREKTWAPKINEVVSSISGISQKISVEGLGELEVNLSLDESDKKAVSDYLKDWVYHPTDQAFLNQSGEPDMTAFVKARSSEVLLPKLLAAVGEASIKKYKEIHIKKDVINFSQEPKAIHVPKYENGQLEELVAKMRGTAK